MKLRDLDDRTVMEAIEGFYEDCSALVDGISVVIANHRYTIPRRPRQKGAKQFPYFYAMDLYELFDFARGRLQMSPSYVTEQCDRLLAVLHTSVSGLRATPDWDTFGQTPLGLCILACGARIQLRREDGRIGFDEVALLSGWEDRHFKRFGLPPTEDTDGRPTFAAARVREAFASQAVNV